MAWRFGRLTGMTMQIPTWPSRESAELPISWVIWFRRFEPGLFLGFLRHMASGHLNLSGYSSHVLLCCTQANSSHFNDYA